MGQTTRRKVSIRYGNVTIRSFKPGKPFKILNATNGGPWHRRHADDQYRSNLHGSSALRKPSEKVVKNGLSST